MTTWTLILFMLSPATFEPTSMAAVGGFTDRRFCENAARQAEATAQDAGATVRWTCVQATSGRR